MVYRSCRVQPKTHLCSHLKDLFEYLIYFCSTQYDEYHDLSQYTGDFEDW